MLGQLPVPMSEAIEVVISEKMFYHNGYNNTSNDVPMRLRSYVRYIDKSDKYDNHQYKHITVYKEEQKKPKYKKYSISLKRGHIVDEYDVDVIDEKLKVMGL